MALLHLIQYLRFSSERRPRRDDRYRLLAVL
jgi:hypothetical protein